MKTIIAGSRDLADDALLRQAIRNSQFVITEVVCGKVRGIDSSGELWAQSQGIPVAAFPADWKRLGRSAGAQRNLEMARYADALIAVWDGKSPGTRNMIETARKMGLRVHVEMA